MKKTPAYVMPHEHPHLGPLSPEVALFSLLLMIPALWNYLVVHALPFSVLAQRYLVVLAGCSLIASLLRHYADSTPPAAQSAQEQEQAPVTHPGVSQEPVAALPDLVEPLPAVPLLDDFSDGDFAEDAVDGGVLDPS